MREIKFRAYDEEANVMVYSDEHNLIDYAYEYFFEVGKDKVACVFLVDYDDSFGAPATDRCEIKNVMQYTGLQDNNGKEIYEGDIVKFNKNCCRGYGVIKNGKYYSCCESCGEYGNLEVLGLYIETKYKTCDICKQLGISSDIHIEVIGNIYENLELLKNKQL